MVRAVEILDGKVRDPFEHRNRGVVAGIELQIDEAADQVVVRVGTHARVAISLDGLGPLGHQRDGFIAHALVAGGEIEPRHAAQPLTHDRIAVAAAPAAEYLTGRRQPRLFSNAAQHIVVRQVEVEFAHRVRLCLPEARPQPDALVVEGLDRCRAR
jgi:hypothetical protein